jgi:predicted acyltransferase
MTTPNDSPPVPAKAGSTPSPGRRLMSVDALRGFDMFWIVGADELVYALHRMHPNGTTTFLARELDHAEWAGFHFYDLIFPLFLFIVGVSLVFSLARTLESEGRPAALMRIARRSVLLFFLGVLYYGGLSHVWPDVRLMGVLNRIALAYFFSGIFFCYFRPRILAAICAALLVGYWALMTLVPIRDIQMTKEHLAQLARQGGDAQTAALFEQEGNPSRVKDSPAWAAAERMFYATTNRVTGKFDPGLNLSDHIDFRYLPGWKWDAFADPEGLLSTLPAIATCLLGVFAGLLLKSQAVPDLRKVAWLMAFGAAAAALGWLWSAQFPVVKKIWTSSFVLVAGGYSAILLGVFYLIVDVWRAKSWCQPFVWIGMNSITLYLVSDLLSFRDTAARLVGGNVKSFLDAKLGEGVGDLTISLAGLCLVFWLARFLYRRKVFLRL